MIDKIIPEFIQQSITRIDENTSRISKCLFELSEEETLKKPNSSSNSVGNLLLQLCGNITQYIISSLGETPDTRERDLEFSSKGGYSKTELMNQLISVTEKAKSIIQKMDREKLMKKRSVQGFTSTGLGNIIHVTEHYSYHTGQIVFWTKFLKEKDLNFYSGFDLNQKNKT